MRCRELWQQRLWMYVHFHYLLSHLASMDLHIAYLRIQLIAQNPSEMESFRWKFNVKQYKQKSFHHTHKTPQQLHQLLVHENIFSKFIYSTQVICSQRIARSRRDEGLNSMNFRMMKNGNIFQLSSFYWVLNHVDPRINSTIHFSQDSLSLEIQIFPTQLQVSFSFPSFSFVGSVVLRV